jgi:hypothetical protein
MRLLGRLAVSSQVARVKFCKLPWRFGMSKRPQEHQGPGGRLRTDLLWSYQLSRLTRQLSQPAFFRAPLNV